MELLYNTVLIEIDSIYYMGVTEEVLIKLFSLDPEPEIAKMFHVSSHLKQIYPYEPKPPEYLNYTYIKLSDPAVYETMIEAIDFVFQPKINLIRSYGV